MVERQLNDMEKMIAALEEVIRGLREGKKVRAQPISHRSDEVLSRRTSITLRSLGRARRAAEDAASDLDPGEGVLISWGLYVPIETNWCEAILEFSEILHPKTLVAKDEDSSE